MRAAQITELTGPDGVEVVDLPDPDAGDHGVLIEVHAAGVTFPEALQTRGLYQLKPPTPFVPGSEVAGIVRAAPDGSGFTVGDRVAGFPGIGGFAELAVAPPLQVLPLPDNLSFVEGAGLPMNILTVHFALARRGRLASGETILVHGAAGGIGTAAVQLAKAMGATTIAVTSTEEKGAVAREAGADHDIRVEGFKDAVKELTDGRGVDLVVDPVGGDRFTDSLRSLAPEGRLLVIGFTAGEIPTVKVNRLLLNNISVVGVGLGAFLMGGNPTLARDAWQELLPHLESGALTPVIGHTMPLDEAADAIRLIEDREAQGKVVLTVR